MNGTFFFLFLLPCQADRVRVRDDDDVGGGGEIIRDGRRGRKGKMETNRRIFLPCEGVEEFETRAL